MSTYANSLGHLDAGDVLVYVDKADFACGYVVIWNGSATFNVYWVDGGEWNPADAFTNYGEHGNINAPMTTAEAITIAADWMSEWMDSDD